MYLTGLSSGGNGCWEMAMCWPQLFAAVAPLASGGGDRSRAATLTNIPIWVFHNHNDTSIPPDGDRETVAVVKAAGGNMIQLTLTGGPQNHDSWTEAFRIHGLMAWILETAGGH